VSATSFSSGTDVSIDVQRPNLEAVSTIDTRNPESSRLPFWQSDLLWIKFEIARPDIDHPHPRSFVGVDDYHACAINNRPVVERMNCGLGKHVFDRCP